MTFSPAILLERVAAISATISVVGERLHIEAPSPLPGDLLAALRDRKPEILALLTANPDTAVAATPPIADAYAFPWPDAVRGLGRRRVGAYTPCADCTARPPEVRVATIQGVELKYEAPMGTWVFYGGTPLCLRCARARSERST